MATDSKPTSPELIRKRPCLGCGLMLDVTFLLPTRPYRCHACGTVFRHHPYLEAESAPVLKAAFSAYLRMFVLSLISGTLVLVAVWYGALIIEETFKWIAVGVTIASTFILSMVLSRQSKDAIGQAGAMLTFGGIGTAICLALGELPANAKGNAAQLMTLAWLAIGGTLLAQFYRRKSLPSVGSDGLVRESKQD